MHLVKNAITISSFLLATVNINIQKPKTIHMDTKDFTMEIAVNKSPEQVFAAINNVRGWWSEQITGATDKAGSQFTYSYKDVHICKMKIEEFVPGKKVVWLVLDNHFNFTKDTTEWKGNRIIFDISEKNGKTLLKFTQVGLVPEYECYEICNNSWHNYIGNSLKALIETGKGSPNPYIKSVTDAESLKQKNNEQ